jgi:hypothetical protein
MTSEGEDDLVPRPPQEVAMRVLALIAVIDKAHNQTSEQLQTWVSRHRISEYFSPVEAAFYGNPAPTRQHIVNQGWRAEALVPLCWSLGLIAELPPLNVQMSWPDTGALEKAAKDPDGFISGASLLPIDVLAEAEQDLYHQHWRVRDARLNDKPMPEELDPGIVYERRYAASWLMGWGEDWDNVPTDT